MKTFYVQLLSDVEVRNRIASGPATAIQALIDQMETEIPHDQLPPHYDWLVTLRDSKR
jgi:hypothetical protein